MLIPLYGFLEGDTIGLLMLATDEMTIREVAEKLRRAASVRVEWTGDPVVLHDASVLRLDLTVAEAGLGPLDVLRVRRERYACAPEEAELERVKAAT